MHYPRTKRLIDIAVSVAVLTVTLPILVVIAAAVPLESRGWPFLIRKRVGKEGRTFRRISFRTIHKNSSSVGAWTTNEELQLTRIGGLLRRIGLDTLPQFFNVLMGQMSLVGPHALAPEQQAHYTPVDWELRHRVRPGITGLAQVSRRKLSFEEKLNQDSTYVLSFSLRNDIAIIRQALARTLRREV